MVILDPHIQKIPLETILDPIFPLLLLSPEVIIPPPLVRLIILPSIFLLLIPRLRTKQNMHILDLLIPPNGIMHPFPPQRLERIIRIRQRDPAIPEQIPQHTLISKLIRIRILGLQRSQNPLVNRRTRHHDLQSTIRHGQPRTRTRALPLRPVRVRMLRRERTVRGDPIGRIMRFLERIADASVRGGEDPVSGSVELGAVERQVHQFVHVLQNQHVAVELYHAGVFDEAEGRELAPAVVEARVVAEVFGRAG